MRELAFFAGGVLFGVLIWHATAWWVVRGPQWLQKQRAIKADIDRRYAEYDEHERKRGR